MRRFLWLILLSACGGQDTGPVAIALGEDACDVCRMIISEAPYAAEARFSRSKVEKYDDVGCLVERLSGGVMPVEAWVKDYASGRWVEARSAHYVHAKELKTPMASGLAAFDLRSDADEFSIRQKGSVLSFGEIKSLARR